MLSAAHICTLLEIFGKLIPPPLRCNLEPDFNCKLKQKLGFNHSGLEKCRKAKPILISMQMLRARIRKQLDGNIMVGGLSV